MAHWHRFSWYIAKFSSIQGTRLDRLGECFKNGQNSKGSHIGWKRFTTNFCYIHWVKPEDLVLSELRGVDRTMVIGSEIRTPNHAQIQIRMIIFLLRSDSNDLQMMRRIGTRARIRQEGNPVPVNPRPDKLSDYPK